MAGLVPLWRRDRQLALTLVIVVALGVAAVAVTPYWTDETWGPRYLLPVAWLLLVPIPWWATNRSRRRILGVVAAIAVAAQLIAVTVPSGPVVESAEALTGAPLYQQRGPGQVADAPFGHDSLRWIPQLSPLVIQTSVVASAVSQWVGGSPITLRYEPYEGRRRRVVLSQDYLSRAGFGRPDFWWIQAGAGLRAWLAGLAALAALASAAMLAAAATGRIGTPRPRGAA
jgi:hypothetical protein